MNRIARILHIAESMIYNPENYHGNIDLLKKEASKYDNAEQLLRSGGFPINVLDKAAFGFTQEEIKELDPKDLKIKWKDDLENAKQEMTESGLNKKEWAETINLSEPIEVIYENEDFYIDDGHHRYWAAKILNKKLPVEVTRIYDKPIAKITGTKNYDYDEFHRSFFRQPKKITADFRDISALKRYLKDKPFHIYDFIHEFNHYNESQKLIEKANIDPQKWDEALEESDYDKLEEMTDKITESMSKEDKESFIEYLSYQYPADAPSWSFMDFESYILPSNKWLIHFSNNAQNIKDSGFTYGIDQMDKLGLTTYFSDKAKEYGGYNFAFIADSKYASNAARQGKYGKHAVMFKAPGIKVYHHADNEQQIIFYGKDIDPKNIVLIKNEYGDWVVQGGKRGELYTSESFSNVVSWVEKNYRQYQKPLAASDNESNKHNIPKYLYHATYKPLLQSIKKNGLITNSPNKNWNDSKNLIYLAINKDIAESYAETSDIVPEEWLDEIVVLEINTDKLNLNNLSIDENNQQNEDITTYQYNKNIPLSNIRIV